MGGLLISIKNNMLIKEIKPINFLFYRVETTINQLASYLKVGQELFEEAVRHNINITGPIHWHYFGVAEDPQKSFRLEISLPVGDVLDEYDGRFHFKRTQLFKAVSIIHDGSWETMSTSYARLMDRIQKEHLKSIASNREIYLNVDFKNPEANLTEIQIGIE
jgi:effector-binding domain-containing protein